MDMCMTLGFLFQPAPMWPSQYWGAPPGSPRSPCQKQSLRCWASAFPLQTPQHQSAHTVLRTASPPRRRHGYTGHELIILPSIYFCALCLVFLMCCLLFLFLLNKLSFLCCFLMFLPFLSSYMRGNTKYSHNACCLHLIFVFMPHSCLTPVLTPPPSQEENNSIYSQKVDILQKMLYKEQQELQVSTMTSLLISCHSVSLGVKVFAVVRLFSAFFKRVLRLTLVSVCSIVSKLKIKGS